GFRSLQLLDCQNNQLTNLSLPDSYQAIHVNCANNQLADLDVVGSNLMELRCDNNLLTSLIISSSIWDLYASNNQISNLILGDDSNLQYLDIHNNQLTSLEVRNRHLKNLNCSNNNLTALHIGDENFPPHWNLEVDCSNNELTDFTIFSNSTIRSQKVKCSGNLFTQLDLSQSKVIVLDCGDNPLLESINWRNGWNYKFDPNNTDNRFENLPN